MTLLPVFEPETPGAIVVPADESNTRSSRMNDPKVSVLHTPEEPADNNETTPAYFQHPNVGGSTHAYADNDGDLYEMVPIHLMAIANGVTAGKQYPADTDPSYSLNYQSRSIEIEGFAATIHQTCLRGSAQWNTVVKWVLTGHQLYGIPLDRAHVIGHYEVANDRSDPGQLDIEAIIEDAKALLGGGDDMTEDEVKKIAQALYEDRVSSLEVVNYGATWEEKDGEAAKAVIDAGGVVHHVLKGEGAMEVLVETGTLTVVPNPQDPANPFR